MIDLLWLTQIMRVDVAIKRKLIYEMPRIDWIRVIADALFNYSKYVIYMVN